MPGVQRYRAPSGCARSLSFCPPDSEFSLGDFLQGLDVQRLVGDHVLEFLVLVLEILQALGLIAREISVLVLPAMQRLLGGAELSGGLGDRLAFGPELLGLPELGDDLLGGVLLAGHW